MHARTLLTATLLALALPAVAADKTAEVHAVSASGIGENPPPTRQHAGPHGTGQRGDQPHLTVNDDGNATEKMLAPRLKLTDVEGRAIMIHEGGDNYSDAPKPLGGGGGRIACGVID